MKSVFIHRDPIFVGHALSLLTEAGIRAFIRNEVSHNLMGASIAGPLLAFSPDLCVLDEGDWPRAMELINASMLGHAAPRPDPAADWNCAACGEKVPSSFGQCWACEAVRSDAPAGSITP